MELIIKGQFVEPKVNREASNYISDHYSEIMRQVPKFGVKDDKAQDLIHDVFISIIEAENEGRGFDISYGDSDKDIKVSQFVYGRIKKYALNSKYRTDVVEKRNSKKASIEVVASCCEDSTDYDRMNAFQKAYNTASSIDELEDIDMRLSINEKIAYVISMSDEVGMNIKTLLQNIDIMFNPNISSSLLDPVKKVLKKNSEFAEDFRDVVTYAIKNRYKFDELVEKM